MCKRYEELSDFGVERREAMLGELIGAMQAHHARRRVRRNVTACCGAALLAMGAVYFFVSGSAPTPTEPVVVAHVDEAEHAEPAAPLVRIVRVETEPGMAERYRAAVTHSAIRLSDTELLETLHAMNRPAGLVRMGEKVFVTASVVDPPTHLFERPNSL